MKIIMLTASNVLGNKIIHPFHQISLIDTAIQPDSRAVAPITKRASL